MPLLLDQDYAELHERGLAVIEDEAQRLLVFPEFQLPQGIYVQPSCDVLVAIPPNYNQDGNDMLWTHPRLIRVNGVSIPNSDEPGANSHVFQGKVFCRWSRHWNQGASVWKPGKDNVVTILRRIIWVLEHPDTQ